jgi:hypothetical protein
VEIPVVGVDCATNESRVGIALGAWEEGSVRLREVALCGRERSAAVSISDWLRGVRGPGLLALDAPLGWPSPLSETLVRHRAGEKLAAEPNEMFRRLTDRFIQETVGKTPLDVGADRIARTAHAALGLLDEVRRRLETPVPLAWSPESIVELAAIEVYPAATLIAHGFRSKGYKAPAQISERREIVAGLEATITFQGDSPLLEQSADALDAVVCLLAAKDFLDGRAMPPPNRERAEREGWIWTAPPPDSPGRR